MDWTQILNFIGSKAGFASGSDPKKPEGGFLGSVGEGAASGSYFGPIGTGIGAGIGALTGLMEELGVEEPREVQHYIATLPAQGQKIYSKVLNDVLMELQKQRQQPEESSSQGVSGIIQKRRLEDDGSFYG